MHQVFEILVAYSEEVLDLWEKGLPTFDIVSVVLFYFPLPGTILQLGYLK